MPAKRTLPTKAAPANLESKPEDSQPTSDSQSSVKSTGKPPAPKREKSDLFSSFAKTKPPKPKPAESVRDMMWPHEVVVNVFLLTAQYRLHRVLQKMVSCPQPKPQTLAYNPQ